LFIDGGFGNFEVFAKGSLFSGFSKGRNRGIFFYSAKIEKNEYFKYFGYSIFSKEYYVPLVTQCLSITRGIGYFNGSVSRTKGGSLSKNTEADTKDSH